MMDSANYARLGIKSEKNPKIPQTFQEAERKKQQNKKLKILFDR
jgi:hypothetical protein